MPRRPPGLLALSPGDLDESRVDAFERAAHAAVSAGLRGVLLREARLCDAALGRLARRLRALLDPAVGGWLGLHDRAHLAADCEADAVHLGHRSLPAALVRDWLEPACGLGVSAHAGDDWTALEGVDYAFFGPVFDVPGKGPPVGLEGLARACAASRVPLWALGGIDPARAAAARAHGASGIATLRGVFRSVDPASAVRALNAAWSAAEARGT